MLTNQECEIVANFLQGFTNPVRLKILCCLKLGEKNVTEIAELIGEKQSNVSQQLKVLTTKGYITRRKIERNAFYSLRSDKICKLMEYIREAVFSPNEVITNLTKEELSNES